MVRDIEQTFGQMIRSLREEKYTLREAARQMGISASYLSDIERGNRSCSDAMLVKLADLLNFDYEELLLASGKLSDERWCLIRVLVGVMNYHINRDDVIKEVRLALGGKWLDDGYLQTWLHGKKL
jgi:transcriptional regulator with XRE-family HTH domain